MKKQSDANYGKKLPESIIFFLDRALGKHTVARRLIQEGAKLKETEISVKHLEEFPDFDQSTSDEKWLEFAGKESFVVLTKDKRIRYRVAEKIMVKKHGVRVFALNQRKLDRRTDGRNFRQRFKTYVQFP